jgi:tetratricopeptide (TPR) repeat protein
MPPRTAWEWLEGYGAVNIEPEKVFGNWTTAHTEVTALLDEKIPESKLDNILTQTRKTVALQPGKNVIYGSGWGALEELLLNKKLTDHLDFGSVGEEQMPYVELLEHNCISYENIHSYLISEQWFNKLEQAKQSWQTEYLKALYYYRKKDYRSALEALGRADSGEPKYIFHLKANIYLKQGQNSKAAEMIYLAAKETPEDSSFNKEALKMLLGLEEYDKMSDLLRTMSSIVREKPLIRFMEACVLAHTGNLDEAESILMENGGLDIPDIREGENSTSQLYIYIQVKKAERVGKFLDPAEVLVPFSIDLRMS